MEYTDFIADFSQRTLWNLDHVQAQALNGNDDVFPVTQLWNSLLGLIVLPRERDLHRIPKKPVTELWAEGWPRLTVDGPEHQSLHDLVTALRNAVAHFNVDFRADEPGHEITSVTLWTQRIGPGGRPVRGSRGWVGRMTVEELDRLARSIAKLYLREFASSAA